MRRVFGALAAGGVVGALGHALNIAFGMTWEILWALVLGFALSAAVQAVVSKSEITRLLPDDSPRTIAIACGLGGASSSARTPPWLSRALDLPQGAPTSPQPCFSPGRCPKCGMPLDRR